VPGGWTPFGDSAGGFDQVTGDAMMPVNVDKRGRIDSASVLDPWATRGKPAAGRQMNRIGRVAGNHDAPLPIPPVKVCRGNSR